MNPANSKAADFGAKLGQLIARHNHSPGGLAYWSGQTSGTECRGWIRIGNIWREEGCTALQIERGHRI